MKETELKQIEEMASLIMTNCAYKWCEDCKYIEKPHCIEKRSAEKIYNAGYRKQEWISVDERLPDVGDTYLVVVKLKYKWETEWKYYVDAADFVFENGYIDSWNTLNDWNEGQECHITHWMSLPQPPKMKGGAE